MKATKLYEEHGLRTFLLVMDRADEAVEELRAFARQQRVTGASLTAIGAARSATVAYFDPEIADYRGSRFDEQMEICSVVGDIATKNGEPVLHAHAVFGRRDASAIGGHLQRVEVFPTMEIVLTETPAHLRKRVDPDTGLALISIDDSTGAP
jgi:uncharacterized protein